MWEDETWLWCICPGWRAAALTAAGNWVVSGLFISPAARLAWLPAGSSCADRTLSRLTDVVTAHHSQLASAYWGTVALDRCWSRCCVFSPPCLYLSYPADLFPCSGSRGAVDFIDHGKPLFLLFSLLKQTKNRVHKKKEVVWKEKKKNIFGISKKVIGQICCLSFNEKENAVRFWLNSCRCIRAKLGSSHSLQLAATSSSCFSVVFKASLQQLLPAPPKMMPTGCTILTPTFEMSEHDFRIEIQPSSCTASLKKTWAQGWKLRWN